MVKSTQQLNLDLPVQPSLSVEDFIIGQNNEAAVRLINSWPNWPGHCLILVGEGASGKSHLAGIWKSKSKALMVDPDNDDWEKALTGNHSILVENAQNVKNEAALFHLYNWTKEKKNSLLMTSQKAPGEWNMNLKDLSSRLKSIPVAKIGLPDDTLLASILAKHFSDRQIIVEDKVISYLVPRIERTFASAQKITKDLDEMALSSNKKITTVMVRQYLEHIFETKTN